MGPDRAGVTARSARARIAVVAVLVGMGVLSTTSEAWGGMPVHGGGPAGSPALVDDPASLVNPFSGTGTGAVTPGSVGEFPGADTPFGMIQWSPDTTPDRTPGSGYAFADSRITGFSLTHLSGTGCASYGDVPILPTDGAIGIGPRNVQPVLRSRTRACLSRTVRGHARHARHPIGTGRHGAHRALEVHLPPG